MYIIPSIDIKDGRCVKLIQGKPGTGLNISSDPLEVAVRWQQQGAERIHVIDLDAAITGSQQNRGIVQRILAEMEIPVAVGGGVRSKEYADFLLKARARWVILGTAAIERPNFVAEIAKNIAPDHLMVAVDSKQGNVLTEGWTKYSGQSTHTLLNKFENIGVGSFLYTDVEVEGTLKGVHVRDIKRLVQATRIPIIYAGGISSIQDLLNLTEAGVKGAVIGMALYKGKFTLQEAMEAVEVA